ncbi:MAG: nuclear transport factor 2 family protein, partial [Bacteroidales bacterium]|nr:nuclear transport factor 2 family protein [Bacteroidales bacterium]
MKKATITTLLFLAAIFCVQATPITVTLTDGVASEALRSKMESSIARILNEINAAQAADRDLNFSVMGVSTNVQRSMSMLWENTPFLCTDDEIVEHCITTGSGYQVRNIPLMMKPTADRAFNEEEYQEA